MGRAQLTGMVTGGAVLLVGVLLLTLTPWRVEGPFHAQIYLVLDAARRVPWLRWFNFSVLEKLSNLVVFAPLGSVAAVLMRKDRWWVAIIIAAILSSSIELAQLWALPDRRASVLDVVINTSGAAIGAGAVTVCRYRRLRREARSRRS